MTTCTLEQLDLVLGPVAVGPGHFVRAEDSRPWACVLRANEGPVTLDRVVVDGQKGFFPPYGAPGTPSGIHQMHGLRVGALADTTPFVVTGDRCDFRDNPGDGLYVVGPHTVTFTRSRFRGNGRNDVSVVHPGAKVSLTQCVAGRVDWEPDHNPAHPTGGDWEGTLDVSGGTVSTLELGLRSSEVVTVVNTHVRDMVWVVCYGTPSAAVVLRNVNMASASLLYGQYLPASWTLSACNMPPTVQLLARTQYYTPPHTQTVTFVDCDWTRTKLVQVTHALNLEFTGSVPKSVVLLGTGPWMITVDGVATQYDFPREVVL